MSDPRRYPTNVFWSDEDDGFIAVATDLPGCSAFGETQPEAIAELQDAIAAWIEAARAAGNPVPAPSNPAREADYSGKVLLRMPRDLHARLATLAKNETVSLNQYLVFLLTLASTNRSFELSTSGTSHLCVGGGVLTQPVTACFWHNQQVIDTTGGQQFRFAGGGEAVQVIIDTGNVTVGGTGILANTGGQMTLAVRGQGAGTMTGGENLEREGRYG
jgi:predicted RNase H-like HicB family nuclease